MGVAKSIARRKPDENYLRYLFHRGALPLDRGMRAEKDERQPGTTLYRNRKSVLALVGGRSTKTGTVQFPKTDISVDQTDPGIGTQEDYPLAEKHARIATYTADRLTYSPDPPTYYGMLDFEGGGRITTEFADVDAASVEVGRIMRMVFRIKAVDDSAPFQTLFLEGRAGRREGEIRCQEESKARLPFSEWGVRSSASAGIATPSSSWSRPTARRSRTPASRLPALTLPGSLRHLTRSTSAPRDSRSRWRCACRTSA